MCLLNVTLFLVCLDFRLFHIILYFTSVSLSSVSFMFTGGFLGMGLEVLLGQAGRAVSSLHITCRTLSLHGTIDAVESNT